MKIQPKVLYIFKHLLWKSNNWLSRILPQFKQNYLLLIKEVFLLIICILSNKYIKNIKKKIKSYFSTAFLEQIIESYNSDIIFQNSSISSSQFQKCSFKIILRRNNIVFEKIKFQNCSILEDSFYLESDLENQSEIAGENEINFIDIFIDFSKFSTFFHSIDLQISSLKILRSFSVQNSNGRLYKTFSEHKKKITQSLIFLMEGNNMDIQNLLFTSDFFVSLVYLRLSI